MVNLWFLPDVGGQLIRYMLMENMNSPRHYKPCLLPIGTYCHAQKICTEYRFQDTKNSICRLLIPLELLIFIYQNTEAAEVGFCCIWNNVYRIRGTVNVHEKGQIPNKTVRQTPRKQHLQLFYRLQSPDTHFPKHRALISGSSVKTAQVVQNERHRKYHFLEENG